MPMTLTQLKALLLNTSLAGLLRLLSWIWNMIFSNVDFSMAQTAPNHMIRQPLLLNQS
jgi:hypothetical protein